MSGHRELPRAPISVAISVSTPPNADLVPLGLSELHVRHAFIELARHLLATTAVVAYGGDLRRSGYTTALFDLVRSYGDVRVRPAARVRNYLAWPEWMHLTDDDRLELRTFSVLIETERPAGAPIGLPPPEDRTAADKVWASKALSRMRHAMTTDCTARVILGGRTYGQQSFYPGVAEEAVLALEKGQPLFVAGGFGGAAHLIARELRGEETEELTLAFQRHLAPDYDDRLRHAQALGDTPPPTQLVDAFREKGLLALGNGLSQEENERLCDTDDVDEVIALVLKGLRVITPLG